MSNATKTAKRSDYKKYFQFMWRSLNIQASWNYERQMNITRTWKNEVPVTCATLFTMPQNTSVIGTRPLPLTLPRNGPRGSTTTLRSLMRQRNWYV